MSNTKKLSRYPGARPFEQKQSSLFFGRENDIKALYRLIKLRSVITLYGKSGTGKSSLLNAGIIPKTLEDGRFVPLVVRFNSFNKDGDTNVMPFETTQLVVRGGKTSAKTFLDRLIKDEDSLWHDVKEHYVRHKGERGLLLIFDQFEELFTYDDRAINFFQEELAEALYTDVPQRYWDALKREQDKGNEPLSNEELELMQQPPQVKILISIRADRLHLLSRLDDYLPNILKNNYELDALATDAATDAIVAPAALPDEQKLYDTPAFAFEPKALKNILDFLTKNGTEKIESTQLQIICNAIQKRVLADKLSLVKADDIGDLKAIIGNFYADNIAALPLDEQQAARLLIEDHLIFEEEERRLPLYEGKVLKLVSAKTLASLVDNHLLRAEPSMQGGYTYELSHDTLVAPVLQARAKRVKAEREAEEARLSALRDAELTESKRLHDIERGKRRKSNIVAALAVLGFLGAAIAGWKAIVESNKASEKNKELQQTLIDKEEAYRQVTLKSDSLLTARQKELESLNLASQKAHEAQMATMDASKAHEEANTNLTKAQIEAQKAEDALVEAQKQEGFAKENAQRAEKTAEELKQERDKAKKILEEKEAALELAKRTETNFQKLDEEFKKAQLAYKNAQLSYQKAIEGYEKEMADLQNATSILNAARDKERKIQKTLKDKEDEIKRTNVALVAAQNREQEQSSKYQKQLGDLQAANAQLSEAAKLQNQSLARLLDKEKEVLEAYKAQSKAQDEAKQARLDLEQKTREAEKLKADLATAQAIKPSTDVTALQLKENELTKARSDLQQAQNDVASRNAELTRLKADLTEANKKNPQYAEQIQKKENELTVAKKEATEAQNKFTASDAEVKRLNQALTIAKTANQQTADAALKQKQTELDDANKKFELAKNNAEKAKNDLAAKQKELENCQTNLAAKPTTQPTTTPTTTPSVSSALEPQMVAIKGGTFQMGSPESETDRGRDETQHTVTVSNFSMGKYEVTQKQWRDVMGTSLSNFKDCDNCPVEQVSWDDIQEYLKKLNAKTGKKYRLPTEAEWEYACRAGTKTPFNTGENLTTDQANYDGNYPYKNFPKGKNVGKTTPVGSFAPNAWGLYDMHGNVWEWCSDWYGGDYYKNSPVQNPQGPTTGTYRVLRGGSWSDVGRNCRSSERNNNTPAYRDSRGFRLVFVP